MNEPAALSPAQIRARNRRNLWIALAIAAFMALVFAITLVRMQGAAP